ncbi:Beta-N-acetylhexosaminidase [Klebsormidium nitens]|uniref:Beta-hexosaminidase n=1 Tax=Klebsormidium nitens TaxID=105231 RepID=A0A1Y1HL12_KLENI|nr:Beta-N-acetylhexosaminidase [Klebsormidium nitens]|eukprot:GAQ79295.1 Beta-N-acetylhexosaminidase [Klebsormidium nitens]
MVRQMAPKKVKQRGQTAWKTSTSTKARRKCVALFSCLALLLCYCPFEAGAAREFAAAQSRLKRNVTSTQPFLVPLPKEYTRGTEIIVVSPLLQFSSNFPESRVLRTAFDAFHPLIFVHPIRPATDPTLQVLLEVEVSVLSRNEELQFGVDESYEIEVPADGSKAIIRGKTVFGARHGIETFSQLCVYDYGLRAVKIENAPWRIFDEPRFPHRGILIDTARHWQPVKVLKALIDSFSYAKINVIHWHLVDMQSFPIEIPSFPRLWDGAWSEFERYTTRDMQDIVEYSRLRGINIMPEIDVPGHAESWGVGYPQLWPHPDCRQPLDMSTDFTWEVIRGIIDDLLKIFPYKYFHAGGDEVNVDCWSQVPRTKRWLDAHNRTGMQAYADFVVRTQEMLLERGRDPVNWEEPFDSFPERLNKNGVVHVWLDNPQTISQATQHGFPVIVANTAGSYLDHLDIVWRSIYMNDPYKGIKREAQRRLVIGGENCMWGEDIDASDLEQTIWPRAAAFAERYWSPVNHTEGYQNVERFLPRYHYFRCLLNQRGVRAAPAANHLARKNPDGPGSCYEQR